MANERHGTGANQRLQTVRVATQAAEHAETPAAWVLVLGEVAEQAGHDARAHQSGAGVACVREARQQQQDGRLWRPGLGVIGVLVSAGSGYRGRAFQSDFSQGGCRVRSSSFLGGQELRWGDGRLRGVAGRADGGGSGRGLWSDRVGGRWIGDATGRGDGRQRWS